MFNKISNQVFPRSPHLAVSNACNLQNTFQHVPNLEGSVIIANIEHPRLLIACVFFAIPTNRRTLSRKEKKQIAVQNRFNSYDYS